MASTSPKNDATIEPAIVSKVEQIKALPYATSIVAEDVIERNFGYKIIRQQISTGRNSMVYKCESVRYPDSFCLIKPFKGGKDNIKTIFREEICQIMRFVSAKCQQLLSTYDIFYTNEKIYLMCDWSQKGEVLANLRDKTVRLTEDLLRQWTIDILTAVQFLHSNAICHRNIAPSCLLLTADDRVKIGTLSDACIYCKPDGTLIRQKWSKFSREHNWNQPPEVAKSKSFDPRRADVWSIGATIYWLICRSYPIDYRSGQRLTKQMDYRMAFLRRVSSKCQRFVRKMLTYQPPHRPTIQQALEFEWITGNSSSPVSDRTKMSPRAGAGAGAEASASQQAQASTSRQKLTGLNGIELGQQPETAMETGEAAGTEESAGVSGSEQTPDNSVNYNQGPM